jgi:hypothetical protein
MNIQTSQDIARDRRRERLAQAAKYRQNHRARHRNSGTRNVNRRGR